MARDPKNRKEYKYGLRPPRSANQRPRVVGIVFLGDLLFRTLLLCYLVAVHILEYEKLVPVIFPKALIVGMSVEFALSSVFLAKFGRWEVHGHLVTLWQVLSSLLAFAVRHSLYANPTLYVIFSMELVVAYVIGIMTDFTGDSEARLPPIVPKRSDKTKPTYGWLGKQASKLFQTKFARSMVTAVLYVSYMNKIIMCIIYHHISVKEDMSAIGEDNLDLLFKLSIGLAFVSMLPNVIVDLATLPEFFSDWKNGKESKRFCKTDPFEVAIIDDDNVDNGVQGELAEKLKTHKCCSITVVIPCYMPNEQEIIFDILDYYRQQEKRYPGEMKVLVVWNSPDEHPDVEDGLNSLAAEWPSLTWRHDLLSTSKCDNLNTAIDNLTTDVALLNDADTIVSAESFIRASLHITGGKEEDQIDIAQSVNTHCAEDVAGYPESGFFCFGGLITMADNSKPKNMATQGMFKHAPFNGRGGFWRVSALKLVGFDHRIIGEDHDAAYRGIAYYGFKGLLDPNMICQEREPPDCASLTKQRVRWETAALEMRRTFPWILRSTYYSKWEAFILIWSQLYANANLPLQFMPMQVFMIIPLGITKAYIYKHVWGKEDASWQVMCENEDCYSHFRLGEYQMAMPFLFMILASIFGFIMALWFFDCFVRTAVTRYRPRFVWCLASFFVTPCTLVPFLFYCQFGALRDFCFGGALFIATKRSPSGNSLVSLGSQGSLTGVGSRENLADVAGKEEKGGLQAPLLGGKNKGGMLMPV